MSWRHSQPRAQSRRRTLERCKGKGMTENAVLIDLENCNFHNIINVDVPESSRHRLQGSSVTRKDKTLPSRSIISIADDESGDDGNSGNGDVDRHATSFKMYHPSSNQSRYSKELDGNESQFIQERKFPLKLSKCKRTYSRKTLPKNRFSLNPVSESSSSESSSSDCELMEGSSGEIREQWEKAASKKKIFTDVLNCQAGSEDRVSVSGSNDGTPKIVEVENAAEQQADVSFCSSSSNSIAQNEDSATFATIVDGITEDPFFKTQRHDPVADLDRTFEQCGPSCCKTQSWDKAQFSHGWVGVQDLGKTVPEEPSFYHTELHSDSAFNHAGSSLRDEEEQVPGRPFRFTQKKDERQINSRRYYFQQKEENIGEYCSFNTQPGNDMHLNHVEEDCFQDEETSFRETQEFFVPQGSHDRVVSVDKNEDISGEPSFHNTHSSNGKEYERTSFEDKGKASSRKPSFCCTESENEVGINHGRSFFQERVENIGENCYFNTHPLNDMHLNQVKASFQDEEASFCYTQELDETEASYDRVASWDKNEDIRQEASFHNTHSLNDKGHESASIEDREKRSSGEPCFFYPQSCDETKIKDCAICSEGKDELAVCGIFSCTTRSWVETEVSDERTSQQGFDKSLLREKVLCNAQPDETQLNHGGDCFKDEEKEVLQSPCSTQPQDEISHLIHTGDENCTPNIQNDIIGQREKLKETDEYKQAAEEEWLSRMQQLQIQAEEAQRLKKRKKAQTLRLLDMERRQKQRLEEMRETKKKDEEAINLKEQLRVEVRKELDKLEIKYTDMASLLRGLGIHVGGGLYPMPREVQVAYKQALLRFHPDRASRTDIRQQVDAEEKFKLVSRLKDKLLPTL